MNEQLKAARSGTPEEVDSRINEIKDLIDPNLLFH